MSIARQALHLLRFDVLRMRWWIALYMVALLSSVLTGLQYKINSGAAGMLPYLVVVIAMLATIMLVNADSPLRMEAFSRGHAVSPMAILMAKLVSVIGLFVLMPLAVVMIALLSNGIAVGVVAQFVKSSFEAWSIWIAIVALIAVVTRDLKGAALLFVGGMLTTALFAGYLNLPFDENVWVRSNLKSAFTVFSVVLVLAVFYRRISGKRVVVLAGLLAFMAMYAAMRGAVRHGSTGQLPAPVGQVPLEVTKVDLLGAERQDSIPAFNAKLERSALTRYSLRSVSLSAFFVNGDSMNVSLQGEIAVAGSRPIKTPASHVMMSSDGTEISNVRSGNLAVNVEHQVMQSFVTVDARGARTIRWRPQDPSVRIHRLQSEPIQSIRIDAELIRHRSVTLASAPFRDGVVFNDGVRRLSIKRRLPAASDSYDATWTSLTLSDTLSGEDVYWNAQSLSSDDLFSFMLEDASNKTSTVFQLRSQGRSTQSVMLPGIELAEFKFSLDGPPPTAGIPATIRMVKWTPDGFANASGTKRIR
ncbi:hypothetical protein [Gemmatimonas groenlandica]|uniref:Uncharacterized protein n=1 Tax=Gemmatimonas groenlandica TaxID=2732249 RepID=A0A6M4IV01_9BACT|nr:hypothetical protein [Gemmatimonas groenlandica]QJR37998.1 hypothetical protein HKW67_21940 [Gemmatimonas groenlandica]